MARIGYARVSTIEQDLDTQLARLKAEGCEIVRSEKVSGASRDGRTELATVIEFLRPGDELVVTRLDRLGRDTRDVLNLIHECEQRGAHVTVLDPHVSTRGEMGHVVLTVLGMVPRWNGASSRSVSVRASKRPRPMGRIMAVSADLIMIKSVPCNRQVMRPQAIAKVVGCSRMQVYRIIKL